MNLPAEFAQTVSELPPILRELVEAELAAGNEVVGLHYGFPARGIVGACVKLAQPIRTRPRESGDGLVFYDRDGSTSSGEFTDEKGVFWVLEPPRPPGPPIDMDAIRDAHNQPAHAVGARTPDETEAPDSALGRFRQSMVMDYEKWHDGIGYDLEILKTAAPADRAQIESFLLARPVQDWRDVEALGALDSRAARACLREAWRSGRPEIITAILTYAPHLLTERERSDSLVEALRSAKISGGLTQALLEVEGFHPPEVIDALFRGVLTRDGETAFHFAAMLMFLHGQAQSAFDWELRPFFFQFKTDNRTERMKAFRLLCEKVSVNPDLYLPGS